MDETRPAAWPAVEIKPKPPGCDADHPAGRRADGATSLDRGRKGLSPFHESLASDSLKTLIAFGAAVLGGLVVGVLLARGLGPAGRGMFELGKTLAFVVAVPAGLGLGRAAVFFLPRRLIAPAELFGAVTLGAVTGTAIAVVLAFVLLATPDWHGLSSLDVALICASVPLASYYFQGESALRGVGKAVWQRRALGIREIVFAGLLALVFLGEVSITTALLALVSHWLLANVLISIVLARSCGAPRIPWSSLRRLVGFGSSQALVAFVMLLHLRIDIPILHAFHGAEAVGQYAVGSGIAELVGFLGLAVGISLFPRSAASTAVEAKGGAATTAASVRGVLVLALVSALGLALIGPKLIEVLLGASFSAAVEPMRILLLGAVARAVYIVLHNDLSGRGRVRAVLVVGLATVGLNVALNLALIPVAGASGAAVASTLTYTTTAVVLLVLFARETAVPIRHCLIVRSDDVRALSSALRPASRRRAEGF